MTGSSLLQTVPAAGGTVGYSVTFWNNMSYSVPVQVWANVYTPDDTLIGPIVGPISLTLPAGASVTRYRTLVVPAGAPPGYYAFIAYVGVYPNEDWSFGHFEFIKSETSAGPFVDVWEDVGEPLDCSQDLTQPDQVILYDAHPDLFNPITTLTFTLPVAGLVKLEVFDINGRSVGARRASPLSGLGTTPTTETWFPAGTHRIPFDGSDLPSGIYFARLTAGEYVGVKKLVLMK